MFDDKVGYLKKIDGLDWASETISERFDNALELLPSSAVVYGGAIRDVIANVPLLGDLDIGIDCRYVEEASEIFRRNPRWVPKDGFLASKPNLLERVLERRTLEVGRSSSKSLALAAAPMSAIVIFENIDGQIAQIMTSKADRGDPFLNAIYLGQTVDIVCCGMIVDMSGTVYEAVPGAYDDCKNKILRLNESSDTIYYDALQDRVNKLVGRGWTNTIDVAEVLKKAKAKEKRAARRAADRKISVRYTTNVSSKIGPGELLTSAKEVFRKEKEQEASPTWKTWGGESVHHKIDETYRHIEASEIPKHSDAMPRAVKADTMKRAVKAPPEPMMQFEPPKYVPIDVIEEAKSLRKAVEFEPIQRISERNRDIQMAPTPAKRGMRVRKEDLGTITGRFR
jgi:hypothetical protein